MIEKLPTLYKCNPQWPICLFDFSFRNLNPKFVVYRVQADFNSFIVPNYFSRQRIDDPNTVAIEKEREQLIQWISRSEDLMLCRSTHICNIGEGQRSFA